MPALLDTDADLVFSLANGMAGAAWIALAASPAGARWAQRTRFVAGRVVPLILAVVYVVLFVTTGMQGGGYDSLAAVQRLMAVPALLTAGWLQLPRVRSLRRRLDRRTRGPRSACRT